MEVSDSFGAWHGSLDEAESVNADTGDACDPGAALGQPGADTLDAGTQQPVPCTLHPERLVQSRPDGIEDSAPAPAAAHPVRHFAINRAAALT